MYPKSYLFAAVIGGLIASSVSGAGFDEKVRNDFFAGFAGDAKAFERAMAKSEVTIAENPTTAPEAMAWHGGGLMFQSGQKFQQGDTAAGASYWSKGLGEMNKAGELAPDSPGVLIPRAAVWFAISRFTPPERGRPLIEKAVADYERVYEIQKSYFDTLSGHMRGELLFGIADGYARLEQPEKARPYFEKLAAVGTPSGHLEQAQLFLKGSKYEVQGLGCVGCHTGK